MDIFDLILQIIFIALVIADCILTYQVIREGKGFEIMPMKYIIKYPIFAVTVTTLGVLAILYLVNESGFYLWLIPLNIVFGYAVWKSWRVLHAG